MSPSRSLLLVVVVSTFHLCSAEWPCPNSTYIAPCECSSNEDYQIYMDCSNVTNSSQLGDAFEMPFPFSDIQKLTIHPSGSDNNLTELPGGVFGDKTFKEIEITNTLIETVEEQALVNSHPTLETLYLPNNLIENFPFETLDLFTALREFDISYNNLSGPSPDIVSDYLLFLDMSGNKGLTLTETTFVSAPYLEELRLSDMDLGTTTPGNVFLTLNFLRTLHLNNNGITGTLKEDFINNQEKPLITVQLIGNTISSIHPLSVTGINSTGTISFKNNQFVYLPQEEWETLVSEVTQENAIDMTSNPLVCGCDIFWLVVDSELMAKFDANTTCSTGNLITDLPQDWFVDHCSSAPMQPSPQPHKLSSR